MEAQACRRGIAVFGRHRRRAANDHRRGESSLPRAPRCNARIATFSLLTLIEYLGEAPDFAGDKLFKTLVATVHARHVCAEGHENKALSLYDRALLDLVFPVNSLR